MLTSRRSALPREWIPNVYENAWRPFEPGESKRKISPSVCAPPNDCPSRQPWPGAKRRSES